MYQQQTRPSLEPEEEEAVATKQTAVQPPLITSRAFTQNTELVRIFLYTTTNQRILCVQYVEIPVESLYRRW